MPDLPELRAAFPVLSSRAYLNAGTQGPVPRPGAEAAGRALEQELVEGRGGRGHFERVMARAAALREAVAGLMGCPPGEVALTRSTTDGMNIVVSALDLGPGDEVLTSDEEHPGLLAPLATARARRGIAIRVAPFAELAEAIGPATRLVACSHVSWVSGRVVDAAALAAAPPLVLLDGAQGLGAVPAEPRALGCDFYGASGQKWLCGPDASGYLWVAAERLDALGAPWPGYGTLADSTRPLELPLRPGSDRLDMGIVAGPQSAWALAAIELLAATGWDRVLARGPELAARLAALLAERGLEVVPRDRSTLVSWRAAGDTEALVARLAAEGFVVRDLPGRGLLRASVGAWSSEDEVERLAAAAAALSAP